VFCAPILHSLGSDSLIRANNAINGMAFKQLRTSTSYRIVVATVGGKTGGRTPRMPRVTTRALAD
jgi:hypothetical protein